MAIALSSAAQQKMVLPIDKAESDLVAKYGEAQRARAHRGVAQVAEFWRAEDGDAAAFQEFVASSFAGDQKTLDALFERMEFAFESAIKPHVSGRFPLSKGADAIKHLASRQAMGKVVITID